MKSLLSQKIGLDDPGPGSSVFHFRFSFSLHSVGIFAPSGAAAAPSDPRNCGHDPPQAVHGVANQHPLAKFLGVDGRAL